MTQPTSGTCVWNRKKPKTIAHIIVKQVSLKREHTFLSFGFQFYNITFNVNSVTSYTSGLSHFAFRVFGWPILILSCSALIKDNQNLQSVYQRTICVLSEHGQFEQFWKIVCVFIVNLLLVSQPTPETTQLTPAWGRLGICGVPLLFCQFWGT